jgi:hypothetical protein
MEYLKSKVNGNNHGHFLLIERMKLTLSMKQFIEFVHTSFSLFILYSRYLLQSVYLDE